MSQEMTAAWMDAAAQLAEDNDKQLYWACKRCFDVVVASIMLVMLAPLMLAIAILIKLDSPGPALFVQQRVGARQVEKAAWSGKW
jgi:lipopolysaccharide/colanic/teichoic acid biosynthesis glycosyltransferase